MPAKPPTATGGQAPNLPPLLTPFLLSCFLNEIEIQCRFVLHAAAEIEALWTAFRAESDRAEREASTAPMPLPDQPTEQAIRDKVQRHREDRERRKAEWRANWSRVETIWYHIQNLVISAAMISKLLWGDESAETLHQRQDLRGLLRVKPGSPLRTRSVRNLSEHIDEDMIEQFAAPGASQRIAHRNIGPQRAVSMGKARYYLGLDPGAGRLTTGGRVLSLTAVVAEAARMLAITEEARESARQRFLVEARRAAAKSSELPAGGVS
jgi:hypothetical protein